jgi:hypothetical protein
VASASASEIFICWNTGFWSTGVCDLRPAPALRRVQLGRALVLQLRDQFLRRNHVGMLIGVLAQQQIEVAPGGVEPRIDLRHRFARSRFVGLWKKDGLLAGQFLLVRIAGLLGRLQLDARGFDRPVQLRDASEIVLALALG